MPIKVVPKPGYHSKKFGRRKHPDGSDIPRHNTRRMNKVEELGRVDAEKADTRKGARNLKDEKKRIVRELKAGGGLIKGKPKLAKKGWK